jgi:hypothetical protein
MSVEAVIALTAAISSPISVVIGTLLGSYLQRQSIEREIRYAKFHERRVDAIDALYQLVVKAQRAFPFWIPGGNLQSLTEQEEHWLDAIMELDHHYQENALWLDQDSHEKMQDFLSEATRLVGEVMQRAKSEDRAEYGVFGALIAQFEEDPEISVLDALGAQFKEDPDVGRAFMESFRAMIESHKRISGELDAVREALGKEFRRILSAAK